MSNDTLTKEEQFLLKDYELRSGQMLHEDKLRHQLITFIITLSTAVIGGLAYVLKGDFLYPVRYKSIVIIACLLLIIIIFISIIIIAKIRKAQLLSMQICENIRGYFYKQDYIYKINILSPFKFPI
jgi:magnesium-transporting ATPase (P-type)